MGQHQSKDIPPEGQRVDVTTDWDENPPYHSVEYSRWYWEKLGAWVTIEELEDLAGWPRRNKSTLFILSLFGASRFLLGEFRPMSAEKWYSRQPHGGRQQGQAHTLWFYTGSLALLVVGIVMFSSGTVQGILTASILWATMLGWYLHGILTMERKMHAHNQLIDDANTALRVALPEVEAAVAEEYRKDEMSPGRWKQHNA